MSDLNITLVQTDLTWENPEANCSHLGKMISGIDSSTDLIILPEMFTTGFTMETDKFAETMDGASVEWMKNVANKLKTGLVGSLIIKDGQNNFNRLIYVSDQGKVNCYDKRHLFRMAGEDEKYAAGSRRIIIEIKDCKILPLICYDLRFPVWSRLVKNEADLIIYIANWPERRATHWHTLLRARAIENQVYVAGVNRIGKDGSGIQYSGGSVAIDPLGTEICHLSSNEVAKTVRLSKRQLDNYRQKFPVWKDSDRFKIL
jgi:predicted amidohydrolase